ncbi:MAG: ABC transporter permease, partial [Ruegeria sp.]
MDRVRYIAFSILSAIPIVIAMVIITFVLMRVLPGDPAVFFSAGPFAGEETIEELRAKLGLDEPLYVQIWLYFRDIASGDWGRSLLVNRPVYDVLMERLPASLELTLLATLLALLVALPLGVLSALRAGTWIDHVARLLSTVGAAIPIFVTALVLVLVFYYLLDWVPEPVGRIDIFTPAPTAVTGFFLIDSLIEGNWEAFRSAAGRIFLPAVTMGILMTSPLTRMTRGSMLAVLHSDFIRTARAAGLSSWTINFRYALRNALIPVLTTMSLIFSFALGANVLVEKVFAWPGVGSF